MLAAGVSGFIVLRFLMGLSECGNYTAGIKALAGLFPAATRSKAAASSTPRAAGLRDRPPDRGSPSAARTDWRMAFVIPSLSGLIWLLPWLATFPISRR